MTMPPDGKSWSTVLRETRLQFQNAGRSLQSGFTSDNFFATARTLAWLVPLTVLIWVYAEREQIDRIESVSIPIRVDAGGDLNLFVELQAPKDAVITATLNGPRGRLEEIRQRVMPKENNPTVVVNIDRNRYTPGSLATINTADALSMNPIFSNSGVTLSNCSPPQLKVFVDTFEERELEVQRPSDVTNLVGNPSFDPRKVVVRAPRRSFNNVPAGTVTVEADLKATGPLDRPGPQVLNNVPLVVRPPIENATFNPTSVRATFEIRATDVKYTYPSMGVSISMPQSMTEKYFVKCNSTIPNVELIGPPDQIELLKQEPLPAALRPTARIAVTIDDLPPNTSKIAKPGANLTFEFPPGAKDVQVNPEKLAEYSIEWTLVERTPADQ
jgi:hypothetical protein